MALLRFALLLLLLLHGALAFAGDDAVEGSAARDVLPAPSAAAAFEFEGYVLRDGSPYGRVQLSARPSADGSGWAVRDAIQPVQPGGDHVLATALLDRRLTLREGAYHRRNAQGFVRATIAPRVGGQRIEHVTTDYENRLDVGGADATSTLAAVVLFLRLVPTGPGVYTLEDLDPNPPAGDPYVLPARIEVHRKAGWRVSGAVRPAWIVSYTRGTQTLRLALDAETRALLGVEFVGLPYQFVPRGSGPVGLAEPGDPDLSSPLERAVDRTRTLRAALPLPGAGLDLRGRILLGTDGSAVGIVWLRAESMSLGGRPAWSVLASRVTRTGEAVVEQEDGGALARDLTLLRGERVDKRPEGATHLSFERVAGGMRTLVLGPDGKATKTAVLAAPHDAAFGLVSVLLFLQQVPPVGASYVLPGWDPRFAGPPKTGSGDFALRATDVHIAVTPGPAGLTAACRTRTGRSYVVHLEPRTRRVLRVVGEMPALTLDFTAPGGLAAPLPVDWYDGVDVPPVTWRQAFVRFGRGYHLPRRDLLGDAFHWPSMVTQAVAQGRYAEGTPEATIRRDWVEVFVQMSKHRTPGDCDDLLFQIFMTSRETHHEDGSVSLHTLPVYGGHVYRMRQIEGRWWVVGID